MTIRNRKQKNDDEHGNEQNTELEKDESQDSKPLHPTWSFFGIIQNILKVLFLLFIVPVFLNYTALIKEERELKPEGFTIDVGHGQNLFKNCYGKGSPTVIFDAPLGQSSDLWNLVATSISKMTKVCYYDRAGLGFSQRVSMGINQTVKNRGKPHTVERMVEDFHRLFDTEEKPFILVGADLGAIVTKFYAQLYQDYVASTILINPIFEGLFLGEDNPWTKFWFESYLPSLQLQHISSATGITRLGLQTGLFQEPFPFEKASEDIKRRQKFLRCKPSHISSMIEESHFVNESLAQSRVMGKLRPYPDHIPLHVIWTDKFNDKFSQDINRVWTKSQEMFKETSRTKPASISLIHGTSPEIFFSHSDRITEIIRKAIKSWREKSSHTANG